MPTPIFTDIMQEMPLPPKWDEAVKRYKVHGKWDENSISVLLRHIRDVHAPEEAGAGSSRIVYKVQYEGRTTVIKFAMSSAGLAQNAAEAKVLFKSPAIMATGMVVPGIDYDTDNTPPLWLHVEYAAPLDSMDISRVLGVGRLRDLVIYANTTLKLKSTRWYEDDEIADAHAAIDPVKDTDFVRRFMRFAKLQKGLLNDYNSPYNWGKYRGNPVIVDAGFDVMTAKRFYGHAVIDPKKVDAYA